MPRHPGWMDPDDPELQRALRMGRGPNRPGNERLLGQIERTRDGFLSQVMGREEFSVTPIARIRELQHQLAGPREVIPEMPRRKIDVQPEEDTKQPIFTWAFASSEPRGGQVINYETRLTMGGDLTCNCPGWVFSKIKKDLKGKVLEPKICKHTKRVAAEALEIAKKFKAGEELPVLDAVGAATTGATASARMANTSKIKHGRVIEL